MLQTVMEFQKLTLNSKPTMRMDELNDLCIFIGCSLRESGYVTPLSYDKFLDDLLKQELQSDFAVKK